MMSPAGVAKQADKVSKGAYLQCDAVQQTEVIGAPQAHHYLLLLLLLLLLVAAWEQNNVLDCCREVDL